MSYKKGWVEEPTVTKKEGPIGGLEFNHPAYGSIGAYRTTGQASLYGSDFRHQHYVTIYLKRSTLRRDLSNDWPHAHTELFEVALSEAQWATFVSSMNVGSGVQCTIKRTMGQQVPGLPDPQSRTEQFSHEVKERMAKGLNELNELAQMITTMGLSGKKQKELLDKITASKMQLTNNVKFVADQFDEHMEDTTEKAKIEINAYATHTLIGLGLDQLGKSSPIALEHLHGKSEDEPDEH